MLNRSENLIETSGRTYGKFIYLSIDDDNFDELFSNVTASSFAHESGAQFVFSIDVMYDIFISVYCKSRTNYFFSIN